jgi:hypothetical protein
VSSLSEVKSLRIRFSAPVCRLELIPVFGAKGLCCLVKIVYCSIWWPEKICLMVAANMSNVQTCLVYPLATSHVFLICRTSIQTTFKATLPQSTCPIRHTTPNHCGSLFNFLPRKVCQSCLSLTLQYCNRLYSESLGNILRLNSQLL